MTAIGCRAVWTRWARGESAINLVEGLARTGRKVVFVFPGQGSQWAGMALELLDSSEVFADRIRACADALDPFVDWSLEDVLRGRPNAPSLDRADVVQPTLFAVMAALAEVWRSFGVKPAAVLGHSMGEIVAACVAGGLSLDDGARVVALWSKAQARLAGRGEMASIPLSHEQSAPRLAAWGDRVAVAAVNGPAWTTISGDSDVVRELVDELTAEGVRARLIAVGLAAHSPQIEALRERLSTDLAPVAPRTARSPLLDAERAAARHQRARRRVLDSKSSSHSAVRAGDARTAGRRSRRLHRGESASSADRCNARNHRHSPWRRGGLELAAPCSGWDEPLSDLACRSACLWCRAVLGGCVRQARGAACCATGRRCWPWIRNMARLQTAADRPCGDVLPV